MIKKILELERDSLNPVNRQSKVFWENILSDDFIEFGSSGVLYTKKDVLSSKSLNSSEIRIEDLNCRMISEHAFLVTYMAFKDGKKTFRSSLWRLEAKEPKLFFHQSSVL